MLSDAMTQKLNDQINLEFFSSNTYLQMSAWCANQGLEGCEAFFKGHADEEMMHMRKLYDYVNDSGKLASFGAIEAPKEEYASIEDVLERAYEHECHVTASINKLVAAAFEMQDFATFQFLQWYVAEQHEEEALFQTVLDKIKVIGTKGEGLFIFDQEMGKLAAPPSITVQE